LSDFTLEYLVFTHLVFQEPGRDRFFLTRALGGEHIGVGSLVITVLKIASLEPAFVDQRLKAVIDFAEADPPSWASSRWLILGCSWMSLKSR
jgi:hypothetical protein